jgi:hypothetical protein
MSHIVAGSYSQGYLGFRAVITGFLILVMMSASRADPFSWEGYLAVRPPQERNWVCIKKYWMAFVCGHHCFQAAIRAGRPNKACIDQCFADANACEAAHPIGSPGSTIDAVVPQQPPQTRQVAKTIPKQRATIPKATPNGSASANQSVAHVAPGANHSTITEENSGGSGGSPYVCSALACGTTPHVPQFASGSPSAHLLLPQRPPMSFPQMPKVSTVAMPAFGDQVINNTPVFTIVMPSLGIATFSNDCGIQTLTQTELQAGALPSQIIPCPNERAASNVVPPGWCELALQGLTATFRALTEGYEDLGDWYRLYRNLEQHADQCPSETIEAKRLRRLNTKLVHQVMDDDVTCGDGEYRFIPGYGQEAICKPYADGR